MQISFLRFYMPVNDDIILCVSSDWLCELCHVVTLVSYWLLFTDSSCLAVNMIKASVWHWCPAVCINLWFFRLLKLHLKGPLHLVSTQHFLQLDSQKKTTQVVQKIVYHVTCPEVELFTRMFCCCCGNPFATYLSRYFFSCVDLYYYDLCQQSIWTLLDHFLGNSTPNGFIRSEKSWTNLYQVYHCLL